MEWLQANWLPLLIVILVVLIFIGIIIYLCKKKGLRQVALEAILYAEKQYNSTTGKERLEIAVNFMYDKLPCFITSIMPKETMKFMLENFIQTIFDEVKELLDYQKPTIENNEENNLKEGE